MTASEAQQLVNLSLKKILTSRSRRCGIDLHRNLLLASVLLKARDACLARTYEPRCRDDAGNHGDAAETSVASSDPERDDVDSRRDDDVTLTSDAVPNCDEETASERVRPEEAQGVRSWNGIPDQALEEWDFLGPDICGEQLGSEEGGQIDHKRLEGDAVTDFPSVDIDLRASDRLRSNSISRKRTMEIDLGVNDPSDEADRNVLPHKKQRTDRSVNCENVCMDFDDLMISLEGECSIEGHQDLDRSKDFVDKLSLSLDFPIASESNLEAVSESSALLSCQSPSIGFTMSNGGLALSSAV